MSRKTTFLRILLAFVLGICLFTPPAPALAGVNEWSSLGPPGGGVTNLVIAPSNPNIIYLIAPLAGIFKSVDGGDHWVSINGNLPPQNDYGDCFRTVAVDPIDPTVVYVAVGEVFKSTDGGTSWAQANYGMPTGVIISVLKIDPNTHTTLYAGTSVGVFKSVDGGTNWNSADEGDADLNILALEIEPADPRTAYVAESSAGVYKTSDGGGFWRSMNTGLPYPMSIDSLTISPSTAGTLYAVNHLYSSPLPLTSQIYKSTDGGSTWNSFSTGLDTINDLYLYDVTVDPLMPAHLYVGSNMGGFSSADGGASWTPFSPGMFNNDVSRFVINPAVPSSLFALASDGVYKTTDSGNHWASSNTGFSSFGVLDTLVDPQTPANLYLRTSWHDLYRSPDHGSTWSQINAGLNSAVNVLAINPLDPSIIYAGTKTGLFKSTNRGDQWIMMDNALAGFAVSSLALDPQNPATIFAVIDDQKNGYCIYKSTNSGDTFTFASYGIATPNHQEILTIAVDPSNSMLVYAGFFSFSEYSILKSANGGVNWGSFDEGLSPFPQIYRITLDPTNPTTLYAGGSYQKKLARHPGVYKRTQNGSWTLIVNGLPDTDSYVQAIVLDPLHPNTLYVSLHPGGVYRSTNGGASWQALNKGLPSRWTTDLAVDPLNPEKVYVGTNGFGVFTTQSVDYRSYLPGVRR
jgi:photosystem II stability/assembly factor-like uncharacterized protein